MKGYHRMARIITTMDTERCSNTRRIIMIWVVLFILTFCLNAVRCDMFCPPAVENAPYNITAEKYNLPSRDITGLKATVYHGQAMEMLATCNFTEKRCTWSSALPGVPSSLITFELKLFGDSDVQMTIGVPTFISLLQNNYSIIWEINNTTTIDSCQVTIGAPIDECSIEHPCVNATNCTDMPVGYRCDCTQGYSGKRCIEGNYQLYCGPTEYGLVFPPGMYGCINGNTTCYVAGVDYYTALGLSNYLNSSNASSALNVTIGISSNMFFFSVCINSSTPIGIYQIIYQFQSSMSRSPFTVTFKPEIMEQNHQPRFNKPTSHMGQLLNYEFLVPEHRRSPGTIIAIVYKSRALRNCSGEIACIQVIDTDTSALNGTDSLSLNVISASGTSLPISYQSNVTYDTLGYFYASGQLTPVMSMTFNLMVQDGQQASDNASVIFIVNDVDEVNVPPVCNLHAVTADLDIRTQPVKNMGSVSCSDANINSTLKTISYRITGYYASFFNVSEIGAIVMYQPVMQLSPGLISFNVTATGYSATPNSSYVFIIPVHINITVPELKCNLTISSVPRLWAVSSNVELKLECDNVYVDKLLIVDFSNNDTFNPIFTKESITTYRIILVVTHYTPANVNFEVMATLGGDNYSFFVMLSMYNPPTFNQSIPQITVLETTPVGMIIYNLKAASDDPAALTYRIINWDPSFLFTMDSNGRLFVEKQLRPISEIVLDLICEVRDRRSNLSARTTLVIFIQDINDPPVCIQPGPIKIRSSLPPDSIITTVSCNDSDVKPQFKNLSYAIYTDPVTVNLAIQSNGNVVLFQALPAGITFIQALVNVSDMNYSIYVQLNITVTVDKCPSETTEFGLYFPETPVNSAISVNCPTNYSGQVYRICNLNMTWGPFNYRNCSRRDLENTAALVTQLQTNISQYTPATVSTILRTVAGIMAKSLTNSSTVLSGDITQVVGILNNIGEITKLNETFSLDEETLKNFASASDIIIGAHLSMWEDAKENMGAMMLEGMDNIVAASLRDKQHIAENPLVKENLAIKRASSQDDIVFPVKADYNESSRWVLNSKSSAFLSKTAFENIPGGVKYSVILYNNVTDKFKINPNLQNGSLSGKILKSDILSFTINTNITLTPPLELSFFVGQTNYSNPSCGYLDTDASIDGVWATEGCTTSPNGEVINCSCKHLTNFAVLMSPYGDAPPRDREILSIISAIGCGISMFCLLITIIVYIRLWKYVKCDRSVLHVNLSACLFLAYIIFLVGVDRTDNEIGCKVVAALLHYIFLVVFFVMLSEGIEVFKSVSFVFTLDSILCKLITLSYGVPMIIVAVSLGVTKTEGYGSLTSCWLSTKGGLIWAFVGPVLLVILINFIILIQVLRIMQRTKKMMVKSMKDRTKSVVRTICLLSPIMGITWVFGVLSVDQGTIVFQYLFAIFNSLQGLFVFICYCLLTPQVQDGFKALKRKNRARSFDSSQVLSSNSGKFTDTRTTSARDTKNSRSDSKTSTNTRMTAVQESTSSDSRRENYKRQPSFSSDHVQQFKDYKTGSYDGYPPLNTDSTRNYNSSQSGGKSTKFSSGVNHSGNSFTEGFMNSAYQND